MFSALPALCDSPRKGLWRGVLMFWCFFWSAPEQTFLSKQSRRRWWQNYLTMQFIIYRYLHIFNHYYRPVWISFYIRIQRMWILYRLYATQTSPLYVQGPSKHISWYPFSKERYFYRHAHQNLISVDIIPMKTPYTITRQEHFQYFGWCQNIVSPQWYS